MADNLAEIHVIVPDGLTGEVLGHLNRLGGTVTNVHKEEKGQTRIEERMPVANLAIFKTWLADFTGGQGRVSEQ
jgi:translation elongation factor EF-G